MLFWASVHFTMMTALGHYNHLYYVELCPLHLWSPQDFYYKWCIYCFSFKDLLWFLDANWELVCSKSALRCPAQTRKFLLVSSFIVKVSTCPHYKYLPHRAAFIGADVPSLETSQQTREQWDAVLANRSRSHWGTFLGGLLASWVIHSQFYAHAFACLHLTKPASGKLVSCSPFLCFLTSSNVGF